MNAYELCQRQVVTIRPHETLFTAAWTMRERNVGCLVVVEPAGSTGGWRPVGLLTDRAIVTQVIARERDPQGLVVEDAMARQPVTVGKDCTIEECLRRMRGANVRRVPVVDERGRLSGILALDDIFEHMAQRGPFAAATLQPGRMGVDRICTPRPVRGTRD
jgi:CBS domain-containing protein